MSSRAWLFFAGGSGSVRCRAPLGAASRQTRSSPWTPRTSTRASRASCKGSEWPPRRRPGYAATSHSPPDSRHTKSSNSEHASWPQRKLQRTTTTTTTTTTQRRSEHSLCSCRNKRTSSRIHSLLTPLLLRLRPRPPPRRLCIVPAIASWRTSVLESSTGSSTISAARASTRSRSTTSASHSYSRTMNAALDPYNLLLPPLPLRPLLLRQHRMQPQPPPRLLLHHQHRPLLLRLLPVLLLRPLLLLLLVLLIVVRTVCACNPTHCFCVVCGPCVLVTTRSQGRGTRPPCPRRPSRPSRGSGTSTTSATPLHSTTACHPSDRHSQTPTDSLEAKVSSMGARE